VPLATGYRAGLRAGVALVPATLVVAVSFGVLARAQGWGVVAPVVASLVVFSGSAQFASAAVLAAGGPVASAVLSALLVNGRFLPMSFGVAPSLKGGRARRALEAQAIVDTSWALANRGDGSFDREVMLGATLPQYAAWSLGTLIGVLAGPALGDLEALGLDVVIPAFFLGLLAHEVAGRPALAAALGGAAVALVLTPFTPPGVPVLAAALVPVVLVLRGAR
jgi:4-azaleucine resistance transporter AzlC